MAYKGGIISETERSLGLTASNYYGVWKLGEVCAETLNGSWTPYIISTSTSTTANTITLGTVNSGNTIVIFTEKSGNDIGSAPSGFTQRVLSNGGNPRIAVYTKIATGTETTITGDWTVAASMVIEKSFGIAGTPQGPTNSTTSTAPSITVSGSSFVAFLTVCDKSLETVTSPPSGWNELIKINPAGARSMYVYTRFFSTSQATGSVTAEWSGTPVNSVLISFT
jgi:hypothetical protein